MAFPPRLRRLGEGRSEPMNGSHFLFAHDTEALVTNGRRCRDVILLLAAPDRGLSRTDLRKLHSWWRPVTHPSVASLVTLQVHIWDGEEAEPLS